MNDTLANFRELKGIGPAREAKLHEAGVYTWAALSEVLSALGNVKGITGDKLRHLSEQAARLASEPGAGSAPGLTGPERSEAFIVRLSLTSAGRPTHSTVTHVRSQTEHPLAGWSPDQIIRFIQEQAGLNAGTAARDHRVVFDLGRTVGGRQRSLDLVVSTSKMAGGEEFEYRATLAGRTYGAISSSAEDSWVTLAANAGLGHPPDSLPLRFEHVELGPGVQRLRLDMAVRFRSPQGEAPALELV